MITCEICRENVCDGEPSGIPVVCSPYCSTELERRYLIDALDRIHQRARRSAEPILKRLAQIGAQRPTFFGPLCADQTETLRISLRPSMTDDQPTESKGGISAKALD